MTVPRLGSATRQRSRTLPRLPIRPRPFLGESSQAFLVRVSLANGYSRPRTLWNSLTNHGLMGMPLLRAALRLPRHRIGGLTGPFPAYVGISRSSPHQPQMEDFNHHYLRWCPRCLQDEAYLRGEWTLKLSCVCVKHQTVLVDRCPRCLELQEMRYASVACQRCSTELGSAIAPPANPELIALQTRLGDLRCACPDAKPSEMTFEQVASLIKHVGQFGSGLPKRRSGQIAGLHRLEIALKLMSRAAHLLSDWPRHFHEALTEARTSVTSTASLKRTYGRLYGAIYTDLHEPCFQFLRDAFDDYVQTDWPNLVAKRNRRLSAKTIAHQSRRPLRVLTRESGVSKTSIKHLADKGLITGSSVRHASGRTTWAFSASAARQAREISADSINLAQTARLLGIQKWRVRELVDASLIRAWIRADTTSASAWSLSKQDVLKVSGVSRQHQSENIPSTSRVFLKQVLQTWRLRNGEFPDILKACDSFEISCRTSNESGSNIGHLSFVGSELRAWLDHYRSSAGGTYSVSQAAKILRVKQQVAYELVRSGFLRVICVDSSSARGSRVTLQAIEEFRREFISLVDIAKVKSIHPRILLSQMESRPVCGPSIDGLRQYFFRRVEIISSTNDSVSKQP